jgi:hypothetical protein
MEELHALLTEMKFSMLPQSIIFNPVHFSFFACRNLGHGIKEIYLNMIVFPIPLAKGV